MARDLALISNWSVTELMPSVAVTTITTAMPSGGSEGEVGAGGAGWSRGRDGDREKEAETGAEESKTLYAPKTEVEVEVEVASPLRTALPLAHLSRSRGCGWDCQILATRARIDLSSLGWPRCSSVCPHPVRRKCEVGMNRLVRIMEIRTVVREASEW